MNRDDIIRMAREAGLYSMKSGGDFACFEWFARLIAEDCAKRCDAASDKFSKDGWTNFAAAAGFCADDIREAYKP